jgi:transposase
VSKKKKWSSVAKFEVALAAIRGEVTLNELCKKYEVAPSQVHTWKKLLLEQGAHLFDKVIKEDKTAAEHEQEQRALFEKIGELTMERDFLKKCWNKLHGSNGNSS